MRAIHIKQGFIALGAAAILLGSMAVFSKRGMSLEGPDPGDVRSVDPL